jgi:hypothetical protein
MKMQPKFLDLNITAVCPDCGFPTTFERCERGQLNKDVGAIVIHGPEGKKPRPRVLYRLFRCSVCSRGGLARLLDVGNEGRATLDWFFPNTPDPAKLPVSVPTELAKEVREAELAASAGALRAGSTLLRSALEKTMSWLYPATKGPIMIT